MNGWNPEIQFFVSHGYAVLTPNYRGSTGYGNGFRDLNKKDWGGGDLQDVVRGAAFLEREGIADGRHLGITGVTYGG